MLIELEAERATASTRSSPRPTPSGACRCGVQAEITALLARDATRELDGLERRGERGRAELLRRFDALPAADRGGVRADAGARLRARRTRIDGASVDFDASAAGLRAAAERNHALAARSDRMSWIGTIAVMLVARLRAHRAARAARPRRPPPRRATASCRELAFQDSLTGLPNRPLFEQRIAEALAGGEPAVVAFLDLDDFKQVNDSLGPRRRRPAAGDLRRAPAPRAARRRTPSPGSAATSSRCWRSAPTIPTRSSTACSTCSRRRSMLEGKRLHLRASIGIASTETGDDLLRNADLAMYAAKAAGTNRFAVFTADMHVQRRRAAGPPRAARARDRERGAGPALPADRRPRPRPRRRLRGAGALAAPDARPARPGRVHPARRGDRPDRAAGPLGPARGLPPGRRRGPARRI